MWEPFITSTVAHVPDGGSKIVFDRFHIMKHMTEAVDQVRKSEHRRLHAEGDETLKGTKYLGAVAPVPRFFEDSGGSGPGTALSPSGR
jgi:transposase